jgi:hypothetical protein
MYRNISTLSSIAALLMGSGIALANQLSKEPSKFLLATVDTLILAALQSAQD